MNANTVRRCVGCRPHEFQDRRFGQSMRVHTERQGKTEGYRCTVCGKETSKDRVPNSK